MTGSAVLWLVVLPAAVALSICVPRPADENRSRMRAYRTLRRQSACLLAGFLLLVVPSILGQDVDYLRLLLIQGAIIAGAIALAPSAISMLALDLGIRGIAVVGGYLAALLGGGFAWVGITVTLWNLLRDDGSSVLGLLALVATACAIGALVLAMEAYTSFRQPPGS